MEARRAFIASFSYVIKGKSEMPIFPYSRTIVPNPN